MEELNQQTRIEALEPISFSIGQSGEMLTLPAVVVWNVATTLKEFFLDRFEPVMGISTPDNPNPAPYFKLKETEDASTD